MKTVVTARAISDHDLGAISAISRAGGARLRIAHDRDQRGLHRRLHWQVTGAQIAPRSRRDRSGATSPLISCDLAEPRAISPEISAQDLKSARDIQLKRYALLQKQLDEDLVCSLDKDGDGVDRYACTSTRGARKSISML